MFDPPQQDNLTATRGWRAVVFVLTLAAATLIYLASGNAIASVVLPCLHAGWTTFRTGLWVLKSDPLRFRARTCFAYYVAAAFWKAALAALLSVAVFIAVAQRTGAEPSMKEFAAAMSVLIIGVVLNTALGLAATVAAIVGKIRVWVHPRLQSALDGDLRWAARQSYRVPGFNHAILVVGTALVFPLVAMGAILLAVLSVGLSRQEAESSMGSLVGCIAIFALPLAAIPGYAWLSARVIARHPVECWPPAGVEAGGL
jgi:hypothetical protein